MANQERFQDKKIKSRIFAHSVVALAALATAQISYAMVENAKSATRPTGTNDFYSTGFIPGEFLVEFESTSQLRARGQHVNSLRNVQGTRVLKTSAPILSVRTNVLERAEYSIEALRNIPGVKHVEQNGVFKIDATPNDPDYGKLWGLNNIDPKMAVGFDMDMEMAWDITKGTKEIVVAVIDTGIYYKHEDLKNNMLANDLELNGVKGVDDDKNGYVDDIYGYNFVNNSGDPLDDHGHGTHCAGTIGAEGDNGIGVVGVTYNVSFVGIKFLSASGSGTTEGAIQSVDYATARNVDIMSNSWGGGPFSQLLMDSIVKAKDKGILFVAAAGNSSQNADEFPHYPASYKVDNIFSVAAVDANTQLAWFSNTGKDSVHVAAPGVDVWSTYIPHIPKEAKDKVQVQYAKLSGTSMATPHVSGLAALLLANDPSMTYTELKNRMMQTATPTASVRAKTISGGTVNAYNALMNIVPPPDVNDPWNWPQMDVSVSTPHPYEKLKVYSYTISAPGAEKVAVYFSRCEVEAKYDYVDFETPDGKFIARWTGKHDQELSPVVPGDTIVVKLLSDNVVVKHGFDITKIAYKMPEGKEGVVPEVTVTVEQ
jgi:thermitase